MTVSQKFFIKIMIIVNQLWNNNNDKANFAISYNITWEYRFEWCDKNIFMQRRKSIFWKLIFLFSWELFAQKTEIDPNYIHEILISFKLNCNMIFIYWMVCWPIVHLIVIFEISKVNSHLFQVPFNCIS